MAASRIASSRRLCIRYRFFFIVVGIILGIQFMVSFSFLNTKGKFEDSELGRDLRYEDPHHHVLVDDVNKNGKRQQQIPSSKYSKARTSNDDDNNDNRPAMYVQPPGVPPPDDLCTPHFKQFNYLLPQDPDLPDATISDKRIDANGGKGPPHADGMDPNFDEDQVPDNVLTKVSRRPTAVPEEEQNFHPKNLGYKGKKDKGQETAPQEGEVDKQENANPENPQGGNPKNDKSKGGKKGKKSSARKVEDEEGELKDLPNPGKLTEVLSSTSSQSYTPRCNISAKDVSSAIRRAKTNVCRQEIADVYCLQQEGKLYQKALPRFCPNQGADYGHYYGCFRDDSSSRDLDAGMTEFPEDNTPDKCLQHCLRCGQRYAGLQYGKECWCGQTFGKHGIAISENHCFTPCPGNKSETCGAKLSNRIFGTGIKGLERQNAILDHPALEEGTPRVKIAFILTVNGRSVRQVIRLLRVIYSPEHYYYIHVDKRQEYLYRELLPLEDQFPNILLTKKRFATIWGGASLLQAHLSFLKELFLDLTHWEWDYYINLSESDYPIKSISLLTDFLTAYKGLNFLKSHGKNTPRFIKKQGLDQTFYECENHLWRVAPRPLPRDVVLDGGSDWLGLWREFAHYATFSNDELVTGLKTFYKYALLPVESFFHTVLHNSRFCSQSVDNNLHITNWRRKQGCKCQYKHIVDWCGCSPNDFKISDREKLMHFDSKPVFFARKFEAVVDQEIINTLDINFHGLMIKDLPGLKQYWENTYHHLDQSRKIRDSVLTVYTAIEGITSDLLYINMSSCAFRPLRLLEVNVFQETDKFQGLLVLFTAQMKNTGHTITLETFASYKQNHTVIEKEGPVTRLKSLEVGSDFDLKELVFRNYGGILGPFDDLSLRHEWGPGTEVTISVAWVDPINVIAASYDVHIPTSHYVGNQKPSLSKPLRPGTWAAKIMIDLQLVAEIPFLVSPLTFKDNKPISVSEILRSHQGPIGGTYTSTDFSEFMPNLRLVDNPELKQAADKNGKRLGAHLDTWVKSLVSKFWTLRATCVTSQAIACFDLPLCINSPWSSKFPDLKSDPTYIGTNLPVIR